MMMTLP
ncbi:hypothetical protein R3I94_017887 [Phoxinus phoxinus]